MAATDKPDAPDAQPAAKAKAAAETVTLAVGHPHDELVLHDEDGKPTGLVITRDGTDVPADQEKAVRDAAKAADVTIRKVN